MVIVLFPIGLGFASWFPVDIQLFGLIGALAGTIGISMFLSQLARDLGKVKETELFKSWGGKPSTLMLSYRYSDLSHQTLSRYHAKLNGVESSFDLPSSPKKESKNIEAALDQYESCGDLLREKTRDKQKFPLIYQENINYGYRRNLWGMKNLGIFTSLTGLSFCVVKAIHFWYSQGTVHTSSITFASICLTLMVVWIFRIRNSWVKIAADAYARQLLASCEML